MNSVQTVLGTISLLFVNIHNLKHFFSKSHKQKSLYVPE